MLIFAAWYYNSPTTDRQLSVLKWQPQVSISSLLPTKNGHFVITHLHWHLRYAQQLECILVTMWHDLSVWRVLCWVLLWCEIVDGHQNVLVGIYHSNLRLCLILKVIVDIGYHVKCKKKLWQMVIKIKTLMLENVRPTKSLHYYLRLLVHLQWWLFAVHVSLTLMHDKQCMLHMLTSSVWLQLLSVISQLTVQFFYWGRLFAIYYFITQHYTSVIPCTYVTLMPIWPGAITYLWHLLHWIRICIVGFEWININIQIHSNPF